MPSLRKFSFLVVAASLLFVSCGAEDEAAIYTVFVTANPSIISHEGSGFTQISARVLDQNNHPAPAGLRVTLAALNDVGEESGIFRDSGDTREQAFLDAEGSVESAFSCSEQGLITVLVQLQDNTRGAVVVDCQVIHDGSSTIENLWASRQRIRPNEITDIFAKAIDSEGDPIAQGVGIRFEIEDGGAGGLGPNQETNFIASTAPDGVASVQFTAGVQQGETRIVASFSTSAMGPAVSDPLVILVDVNAPVDPAVLIVPTKDALLADGESTTDVRLTVFAAGGEAVANADINLEVDRGTIRDIDGDPWTQSISVLSDPDGEATIQLRAGVEPGRATITASVPGSLFTPPLEQDVVDTGTVRLLSISSIRPLTSVETLGVQGSGRNESSQLCFEVRDTLEETFPEGFVVNFNVTTSSAGGDVLSESERTDAVGRVCTTVISGSTFGVISIEPCVEVGRASVCGDPVDIPVSGATPTRAGMSITCDDVNIGALRYLDESFISPPAVGNLCTACRITLADRVGNKVAFPMTVTFAAETGTFSPSARATNNSNGVVSITWCAEGNKPTDVEPFELEPWWSDGTTTINPRDGLVTIIAYVTGEEEYDDENENGRWDEGEVFWDLSEPFIDVNENNMFDPDVENERHIDVEGDDNVLGEFDLPNLEWDAESFIWVQTHVLLTGSPEFAEYESANPNIEPEEFPLDADYTRTRGPFALSHWFVLDNLDGVNVYNAERGQQCFGGEDYCLSLSSVISPPDHFSLFFVARDMFGNPMNASLGNLGYSVSEDPGCRNFSVTDTNELTPRGTSLPFTYGILRESVDQTRRLIDNGDPAAMEQLYNVQISDFSTGSSERFVVNWSGSSFDSECHFEAQHSMKACPSCGDPSDSGDWPYFLLTD